MSQVRKGETPHVGVSIYIKKGFVKSGDADFVMAVQRTKAEEGHWVLG